MRNLHSRLQHLERRLAAGVVDAAACQCWTVVHDEDEAPRPVHMADRGQDSSRDDRIAD
jgi:hypothetical protein